MGVDKNVARMLSMRRNTNSIACKKDVWNARRIASRNVQYRTAVVFCCGVMSLATLAMLGCNHQREASKSSPATVVFICEHGAAKSVIAAAYFNKLAAERHLSFHAISRGLRPQPDLSSAAVAGLEKDGVPFSKEKPRPFSPEEVQTAVRVVAFCPLPESPTEGRLQSFDVPAPKDGYATSRDAIVVQVNALIDQLASQHR
jgi:arsenate reductase